MLRTILLLAFTFVWSAAISQPSRSDSSQLARVNVFVTDMKGQPSQGEQIFFKNESLRKVVSGRSDAAGRFSLQLPVGAKYVITVKALNDTTSYGVIDIPAPGPGEYYTEPFKVDIKFEPARSYTLDDVQFDFGKATLRSTSFPELEELVTYLRYKDNIHIEIAGHTDNIGKDADNLKLSQQRAEAIRNYILKKGIQPNRVVAKGYGAYSKWKKM